MKNRIVIPNPILNQKELNTIDNLTIEYKKYIEPGALTKLAEKAQKNVLEVIPDDVKTFVNDLKEGLSEKEIFSKFATVMAKGYTEIESRASSLTISKQAIVEKMRKKGLYVNSYEDICMLRGYEIESVLNLKDLTELVITGVQGGATGFFGFKGIPANIVLSTFLYFRAVQNIALYYGYDIKNDPSELQIASTVTMQALSPNIEEGGETLSAIIGKMMFMTKSTALRNSLNESYKVMIEKGGVQLIFVQIRALANKAAEKAIREAGEKGLEKKVYSEILEQIGKSLSKKSAKKFIPGISMIVGAVFDTYLMSKVLRYAKIVYHKRFLLEKEQRIYDLYDINEQDIIDV